MSKDLRAAAMGAALAVVLVFTIAPVRAEDSGVFKNPADISRAQRILDAEGYLAPGSYGIGRLDGATRQALSEYQGRHALNSSGTLDDETYQTLLGHEVFHPWVEEGTPQADAAPAEVPAPAAAPEPAAEAAVSLEPAPSPVVAEEAAVPAVEAEEEPVREMPVTASNLPILVLGGLLLLGSGILVLRRRTA